LIRHLGDVVADPHLPARRIWHDVQNEDNPPLLTAGTPFVIDGHKPPLSPTWRKLGEHTESVLREWLGDG
jgi:crotonobetainyl-CoA:carnitine CoA-transferase CaiB-like acyl-CoA transferase